MYLPAWKHFQPANTDLTTPPMDKIYCLAFASDVSLWLRLEDRAVRFDGRTWRAFTLREGRRGLKVCDIYIAPQGSVWFAMDGGITHFTP